MSRPVSRGAEVALRALAFLDKGHISLVLRGRKDMLTRLTLPVMLAALIITAALVHMAAAGIQP